MINPTINHKSFKDVMNLIEQMKFDKLSETDKDNLTCTTLFKQAWTKDVFRELVYDFSDKILENLCLILYAQQFNSNLLKNVNHWKTELCSDCIKILEFKLNFGDKHNALIYTFYEYSDLNIDDRNFDIVAFKFKQEGFNLYNDQSAIYDVIEQFHQMFKEDLIPLMAATFDEDSKDKLISYIEDL